jgi:nuclear pore complex protein Nup53
MSRAQLKGAMATPGTQPRSASRGGRSQSLFYRDLSASPVTRAPASRRELGTPGQAAAAAALWRENIGGVDPPPPPMFTLEDRIERPVDAASETYRNPDSAHGRSPTRTPLSNGYNYSYPDPIMGPSMLSASPPTPPQTQSAGSPIWWSASRDRNEGISGRAGDKDGGSPVSGVVQPQQPGGLLALEPPRDLVRPEVQRSGGPPDVVEGDEWVTVFGYTLPPPHCMLSFFTSLHALILHLMACSHSSPHGMLSSFTSWHALILHLMACSYSSPQWMMMDTSHIVACSECQ